MFDVLVNPGKNRLYVTLAGTLTPDEARLAAEHVMAAVKTLRPGFDAVSDVAGLQALTPVELAQVARTMQFLIDSGVGRVVGKSAETALQFEKRSKEMGYSANLAYSIEEANRLLDGSAD